MSTRDCHEFPSEQTGQREGILTWYVPGTGRTCFVQFTLPLPLFGLIDSYSTTKYSNSEVLYRVYSQDGIGDSEVITGQCRQCAHRGGPVQSPE